MTDMGMFVASVLNVGMLKAEVFTPKLPPLYEEMSPSEPGQLYADNPGLVEWRYRMYGWQADDVDVVMAHRQRCLVNVQTRCTGVAGSYHVASWAAVDDDPASHSCL